MERYGGTGFNDKGQLGQNDTKNSNVLKQVKIDENTYLTNIIKISVYEKSVMALTKDGYVYAWGQNESGKLGQGNTNNLLYATLMKKAENDPITNIIEIAMGQNSTYMVDKDGTTYGAGLNSSYQIDSTGKSYNYVCELEDRYKAIKLSAGATNVVIMQSNGKTYMRGDNSHGESGNGTKTTITGLIEVGTDINDVDTEAYGTVIIKEDGTVWRNRLCQRLKIRIWRCHASYNVHTDKTQ